jgi:hypothetical protein
VVVVVVHQENAEAALGGHHRLSHEPKSRMAGRFGGARLEHRLPGPTPPMGCGVRDGGHFADGFRGNPRHRTGDLRGWPRGGRHRGDRVLRPELSGFPSIFHVLSPTPLLNIANK